jgi:CspA family cold shock protein
MNGKIKFYNFKKRFGFITGEDGQDYFFHQTGIVIEDQRDIRDDKEVTFDVEESDRGPKAVNVKLVNNEESSEDEE